MKKPLFALSWSVWPASPGFCPKLIALVTSLLLASGCSTVTPQQPIVPDSLARWEAHKAKISTLNQWRIEGLIFIDAGKDGFSSRFSWQQEESNYQLYFTAPFSQGSYQLAGTPEKVTIRLPDNSQQSADDPETLLKKSLGFKLPVTGLFFWLRGIPDPTDPDSEVVLDTNERLTKLEQADWDIEVTRYVLTQGYYLPKKLTMENRQFKLKLVIKQWALPQ